MTSFDKAVPLAEVRALFERYRNWGSWGPDDELGHMNYVTSESVRDAAALVKKGASFAMAIPLDSKGPMTGYLGRVNPIHVMLRDGGDIAKFADDRIWAGFDYTDDAVYLVLQCATQWDAFAHVFWEGQMYNGFGAEHVDSGGAQRGAITNVRGRMAGRGVLLDIPRSLGRDALDPGESIEREDLEHCCEQQGVEVREGDFVAVRTGRLGIVKQNGWQWTDEYAGGAAPGLGISAAEFFVPRRVAAVATDTMAFEVQPSQTQDECNLLVPVHVLLTIAAGIHLGEMWDLEELAADCAEDGVYEYFVVAPPLPFSGAVGSPVNPQAFK
jgi:kynurenine formamidase